MDFAKVLEKISEFLRDQGVRFGIAGAVALNAHGLGRMTSDLDIIVDEPARDALLSFMKSLGYQELRATEGFSTHLHPDSQWGRIAFIYLDPHTADLLFNRAKPVRALGSVEIL